MPGNPPLPRINGIPGAWGQPDIIGRNEYGDYGIFTWEGTRAEINSIVPSILGAKGTFEIVRGPSGGKDRLTARFAIQPGQAETPIDEWELFYQEVEKDILECDIAVVNAMTVDDKTLMRDAVENYVAKQPAPTAGFSAGAQAAGAGTLYLDMIAGQKSKRIEAPVIRHTVTVSQNFQLTGYIANALKILKTATMVGEGIPNQIQAQMPTDANPSLADGSSRQYGWLKKRPTVRISLHQKTQLVQEYEYGLWGVITYGAAI